MKTFQMNGRPEVLEFTNKERKDEKELFDGIMAMLKSNPDVVIGLKRTGPSEDFYECTLSGRPFVLYYDINYGASIYSENSAVINSLIAYFG